MVMAYYPISSLKVSRRLKFLGWCGEKPHHFLFFNITDSFFWEMGYIYRD